MVERARYEAELARRRFQAVDPENRLVARTLERDWEARLAEVERLERESAARPALSTRLVDPAERARILALAQDLPALWQAATTTQVERKQLLGFLIKDVCLTRAETTIEVAIRWRTEACTVLNIPRPKRSCDARRTDPAALARFRALAADTSDRQIAEILNQEGFRSGTGRRFTTNIVKQLRYRYSIPSGCPEARGVRRGLSGGWSLLCEGRGGVAQGDGLDDRGLVPVGRPGRHPVGVPRPLVDQVDARDHRPLAQAHASLLDPAFGLMSEQGPRKGRNLFSQSPTPLQRGAV